MNEAIPALSMKSLKARDCSLIKKDLYECVHLSKGVNNMSYKEVVCDTGDTDIGYNSMQWQYYTSSNPSEWFLWQCLWHKPAAKLRWIR